MQLGVNVDPRHGFRAEDIAAPGVAWVRTVLTPDYALWPWIEDCHAHDLKVLGVIARESFRRGWIYKHAARYYGRHYAPSLETPDSRPETKLDAWQIGNEPDLRSPSSWAMRPERLGRLLRAFRAALPDATIIGPGLASGQPSYPSRFLPYAGAVLDAIAIHPYGQRPTPDFPSPAWGFGEVQTLVDLYRQVTTKPLWVTEFGGPDRDFDDEHQRAQYHSEMLLALSRAGVEVAMVFCWSDAMVPGFGLIDAQGAAKESYAAFFDGARAILRQAQDERAVPQSPIPNPQPPFVDYRGQLPANGHYAERPIDRIIGATLHYTATPASLTVEQIAAGQLQRDAAPGGPKFPAIAYTLVVPEDGSVALCHDLGVRTWHSDASGRNDRYVGIAYIGNHEPNPAQLAGLRSALRWVETQLGRGLQVIEGHKDGRGTACPGPMWPGWREAVLP